MYKILSYVLQSLQSLVWLKCRKACMFTLIRLSIMLKKAEDMKRNMKEEAVDHIVLNSSSSSSVQLRSQICFDSGPRSKKRKAQVVRWVVCVCVKLFFLMKITQRCFCLSKIVFISWNWALFPLEPHVGCGHFWLVTQSSLWACTCFQFALNQLKSFMNIKHQCLNATFIWYS